MDPITAILVTVITAATPLLFAALGELVVERAGVLNLGVEGMMVVGAVTGFVVTYLTGSGALGVVAAAAAGALLGCVFGLLTLTFLANQVATGLALTIFGIGLSALLGAEFVGTPIERLPELDLPWLGSLPIAGPLLFQHNALVYLSVALVPAIAWFLGRSRAGLVLRACGEAPGSAHALGHAVIKVRYLAVLFGGAMAGTGGAFLSLVYTPMWIEAMTAGRGWIALALVVFAAWRPARVLLGAYLFGGVTILQLHFQAADLRLPLPGGGTLELDVPAQFLSMLPYLMTIAVLVLIHAGPWRRRLEAPAALGQPFRVGS